MDSVYPWRDADLEQLRNLQQHNGHLIFIQGKLVIVKAAPATQVRKKPNERKKIKGLSQKSRFNLLRWIARIDWDQLPKGYFVTLTYPDERARVGLRRATVQRSHFVRATENHLEEQIPILWRKEYKTRQTGRWAGVQVFHWHLCVFTAKPLDNLFVNEAWTKIIKAKRFIQTDVKPMNSGQHAAMYTAKYLTKEKGRGILDNAPKLTKPGRAWGWLRKNLIPMCPIYHVIDLSTEQWQRIMEQVCALSPHGAGQEIESFTLLGPKAMEAQTIIAEVLS